MPDFVVLEHDHPVLHWDLMLDTGESLRTWRLANPPSVPADIPSESLPDHRLDYLTYEGPVSHNRGHVRRVFAGVWELAEDDGKSLLIRLNGPRLNAAVTISPASGSGIASFRHGGGDGAD